MLRNEKIMLAYTLAADEHVMAPDEEPKDGDGHAGGGDEAVAEDALARKGRDHLADHAHCRQHHDVHCRVRIKPEVLEQNRIAAQCRVEDADAEGRSSAINDRAMATTGVPRMKIMLVAYCAQMNSGKRNQVSPGARIVWMVTMKFSPVKMEEKPATKMPAIVGMT